MVYAHPNDKTLLKWDPTNRSGCDASCPCAGVPKETCLLAVKLDREVDSVADAWEQVVHEDVPGDIDYAISKADALKANAEDVAIIRRAAERIGVRLEVPEDFPLA